MDAPLFDDRERDDDGYRRPGETTYAFLDRASRPDFAAPRNMLNAWFERYPADARERLRSRLMAKQRSNFDGAFWELYLHEVHRRLGFTITIEPEMPDVTTRPDFLMQRDGHAFYVEATVVSPSTRQIADEQREATVIAMINAAYHPDFSIHIDAIGRGPQQPAKHKIVAAVERWLGTLDWPTEWARVNEVRRERHHIEVNGTHLFLTPHARHEEARGDRSWPTVISGPPQFGIKDEPPLIRDEHTRRPPRAVGPPILTISGTSEGVRRPQRARESPGLETRRPPATRQRPGPGSARGPRHVESTLTGRPEALSHGAAHDSARDFGGPDRPPGVVGARASFVHPGEAARCSAEPGPLPGRPEPFVVRPAGRSGRQDLNLRPPGPSRSDPVLWCAIQRCRALLSALSCAELRSICTPDCTPSPTRFEIRDQSRLAQGKRRRAQSRLLLHGMHKRARPQASRVGELSRAAHCDSTSVRARSRRLLPPPGRA